MNYPMNFFVDNVFSLGGNVFLLFKFQPIDQENV